MKTRTSERLHFAEGDRAVERRLRDRAEVRVRPLGASPVVYADWDELTMTIRELKPAEVWITHGREEALKHWCMMHQIEACELNLVGYEDEDE